MRTKLLEKLNSRRGASLTFALLLFLVCAAVGSVVLASASATAGRASGNYAYDQRYYAVTSAAELLRDTLDGQTATFTLIRKTYRCDRTVTTRKADGTIDTSVDPNPDISHADDPADAGLGLPATPVESYSFTCAYPGGSNVYGSGAATVSIISDNLLGMAAASLVNDKHVSDLFANTGAISASGSGLPAVMTLKVAGNEGLTVTVTPELKSDGSLRLKVENPEGDKYVLYVDLTAVRNEDVSSFEGRYASGTKTVSRTGGAEGTQTFRKDVYEKQETKTVTVTWRVSGVGKAA